MIHHLRKKVWSPYVVGLFIGMLSWFTILSADHPIGVTSAFENTAAVAVATSDSAQTGKNSYFAKPDSEPRINWEWFFVIGIFGGAFISSKLSHDVSKEAVPELWRKRFGSGRKKRYLAAFFGGLLMMVGARIAQGCTSGHIISGTLQLAISSWVFAVVVFISGIVFSRTIYGKKIEEVYGKLI